MNFQPERNACRLIWPKDRLAPAPGDDGVVRRRLAGGICGEYALPVREHRYEPD
jgi:hypothetical protein